MSPWSTSTVVTAGRERGALRADPHQSVTAKQRPKAQVIAKIQSHRRIWKRAIGVDGAGAQ
jgi:hypothetical protein